MGKIIAVTNQKGGVGKTTVTAGIIAALTRRGYRVQPFKAGPDFIDPTYHQMACGVPCRNLDTWLLKPEVVLELFARATRNCDVAVVEGVMGLFDGHDGLSEAGSTAQLAKLLGAPVILVADASKVARSIAAEVLGFQQFDHQLDLAGVVLNGIAGDRHFDFCQPQIEVTTHLPVLGYLPRREDLRQPERHLGLVPTVEGTVLKEWYDRLVAQVEETIDLERVMTIARQARTPGAEVVVYPQEARPQRATIAVARDKAFSFYYQDSLDLLEAWGATLLPFSPLEDTGLPQGARGVYIGGGFPEMYDRELAENTAMMEALRQAARRGLPIYGECGGLMYLGNSLTNSEGVCHQMVGLIPVASSMEGSRLNLGYREVEALRHGPVMRRGQRVRGHEFHWSILEQPPSESQAVYEVLDQQDRLEGFGAGSVWASYVHLHLGSDPTLAPQFVESCRDHSQLPG